jgi:hypothetical protein
MPLNRIVPESRIATAEIARIALDNEQERAIVIDLIASFLIQNKAVVFKQVGDTLLAELTVIIPEGVEHPGDKA